MSAVRGGFTLVEVLISLVTAALVLGALAGVVGESLGAWEHTRERHRLTRDARFALERMGDAVSRTRRLLLPLEENPATAWSESVRDVLAVTLDPQADRDGDGFADADNDRDGRIDEDHGSDATGDAAPGIYLVDDDGDGRVDESASAEDDDEDGASNEDRSNGIDDDGDGAVDEDAPGDMNGDGASGVAGVDDDGDSLVDEEVPSDDDEDGAKGEDWLDPVVYLLQGTTLVERMPNLGGANGRAFTERPIAENVTGFRVERLPAARATLVDLSLDLTGASGETVSLHTRVRVGSGS